MSPTVKVDVLEDRAAFRALRDAWARLARTPGSTAAPGPFTDPEYLAIAAVSLARPPRALRVLVAHDGTEPVGVAPLLVERRRLCGVPARLLRSLSDDHSQRFDLVARDDAALAALWRALAAMDGWDALELRDVPEGESRAGRLHELAARDGHPVATWASQRSPRLALPSGVTALERSLDARFRANLRRRRKHLAQLGEVTLERVAGDIDHALDDGFALERSGWKGEAGTAVACDPALLPRYRALAHAAARRGELSLHFLRVGSRRVAFHFALESGGVYYLYKPGFDEALRRYGLGHLLTWEVARALVERGAREIDFLGEDVDWKREWTAATRPHAWRYVFRPTPFGRALHAWKARLVPALVPRARAALDRLRADLPGARAPVEA